MPDYQVIYLTGGPASGKTSLGKVLQSRVKSLKVFHYSTLLAQYITPKGSVALEEHELRTKSAKIITIDDVRAVDDDLIRSVQSLRKSSHVLIDSHAVTKEDYGYRVTPFSYDKLLSLHPSIICMLYAEAHEIRRRISENDEGRPMISSFEADYHTFLQSQVAVAYALHLGTPLYIFDSTNSVAAAARKLTELLNR